VSGSPNTYRLITSGDLNTRVSNNEADISGLKLQVSDQLYPIKDILVTNPYGTISFLNGVRTTVRRQIICTGIGSSIGLGAGSSNGATYAPNSQFVDQLTKQLASYGNIDFVNDNQSIGSQAIQQFSAQLVNSPYSASHFVLIVAGMNDAPIGNYNTGLTYPAETSRLISLIQECQSRGAIPILCTTPHNDVTKMSYVLPAGVSSAWPVRMFSVAGVYKFDSAAKTINNGYFSNPGYGGHILNAGDQVQVTSGPNAGTYTIASISTDRNTLTTVEAIPVTDNTTSTTVRHTNPNLELILEPPPSRSTVTRDWTGNGVQITADARFWALNNMFRSAARQTGCFLADCEQSFLRQVEISGWSGVFIPANFNHFNDLGYTAMGKPIRQAANYFAEQMFLNNLIISN